MTIYSSEGKTGCSSPTKEVTMEQFKNYNEIIRLFKRNFEIYIECRDNLISLDEFKKQGNLIDIEISNLTKQFFDIGWSKWDFRCTYTENKN